MSAADSKLHLKKKRFRELKSKLKKKFKMRS